MKRRRNSVSAQAIIRYVKLLAIGALVGCAHVYPDQREAFLRGGSGDGYTLAETSTRQIADGTELMFRLVQSKLSKVMHEFASNTNVTAYIGEMARRLHASQEKIQNANTRFAEVVGDRDRLFLYEREHHRSGFMVIRDGRIVLQVTGNGEVLKSEPPYDTVYPVTDWDE